MESLMLEPTKENIEKAIKEDIYHRLSYILNFINFLGQVKPHFVIELDGKWGSGKTFFVKEVQTIIEQKFKNLPEKKREYGEGIYRMYGFDKYKILYFDAWIHDNDESPLQSILNELLNQKDVSSCLMQYDEKDIAIKAIEAIMTIAFGNRVKPLSELVNMLKGENVNKEYKEKTELEEQINILFEEILKATQKEKIVFFIDELDRCKPTYAVRLLEQMKHYFNHDKVIFVLAANLNQLQYTIRRVYGEKFAATSYLNRFIDLILLIPEIKSEDLSKALKYDATENVKYNNVQMVLEYYKFSLRESTTYIRMMKIDDHIPSPELGGKEGCIANEFLIPILRGIQLQDIDAYNEFITGKSANEFINIVETSNNIDAMWRNLLLSENETFYQENVTQTVRYVNFKKRFLEFYQYSFVIYNNPRLHMKGKRVGEIEASQAIADYVISRLTLLNHTIPDV